MMASKLNSRNASSQRSYTRSQTLQNQVEVRVRACQRQYNIARSALLALRGPGDWETTLAVLKPEDVRGISERALTDEEKQEHQAACRMAGFSPADDISDQPAPPVAAINPILALGEGRRKLSWIWYAVGEGELNDGSGKVEESEAPPLFRAIATYSWTGLRVEWLKQRARAHRWREELILVEEEMRRSLAFCLWRAQWWTARAIHQTNIAAHLAEGQLAYAMEQKDAEEQRAIRWAAKWGDVRERARRVLSNALDSFPDLVVELEAEEQEADVEDA
jgi:hypothetical protein